MLRSNLLMTTPYKCKRSTFLYYQAYRNYRNSNVSFYSAFHKLSITLLITWFMGDPSFSSSQYKYTGWLWDNSRRFYKLYYSLLGFEYLGFYS